jgi:hypothetical protein
MAGSRGKAEKRGEEMTKVFKMLEDKNFWYGKYLACTEAFLAALRHAPGIALEQLELFYGNRESLLKILDDLDKKLEKELAQEEKTLTELSSEQATKFQYYLREKDSIIEKIVLLDKEIMDGIDVLREHGAEKLKRLAKGKKALANYKSASDHNEKIDKRV